MLLKRFYKTPDGWEKEVDGKGNCTNPPPLDYISIGHTGISSDQYFSSGLIEAGIREGWISISKGYILLHAVPETLTYTINRGPGRYCIHCGAKLDDDATGELARAHVAQQHPNSPSPDPKHPAGYHMVNGYQCTLNNAQHQKYCVKGPAKPVHFPAKAA